MTALQLDFFLELFAKPKKELPRVELKCQCGKLLTEADPCPLPAGRRCPCL